MELERRDNPDAGTVSGSCFADLNQNSSMDTNEPRLTGVSVTSYDSSSSDSLCTITDGNGNYGIENMAIDGPEDSCDLPANSLCTTDIAADPVGIESDWNESFIVPTAHTEEILDPEPAPMDVHIPSDGSDIEDACMPADSADNSPLDLKPEPDPLTTDGKIGPDDTVIVVVSKDGPLPIDPNAPPALFPPILAGYAKVNTDGTYTIGQTTVSFDNGSVIFSMRLNTTDFGALTLQYGLTTDGTVMLSISKAGLAGGMSVELGSAPTGLVTLLEFAFSIFDVSAGDAKGSGE